MSLISNISNYGGKQSDNQQNIKQFVISPQNNALWIYKTQSGYQIISPENKSKNVLIPQDLYVNNDLYVENNIYNLSDRNKKTNIQDISYADNLNVLKLKPKTFQYLKTDEDINEIVEIKKTHYGFIAQDVEEIFPELVNNSIQGYKNVNYIELIPIMISKIQEMQNEIDNLKSIINK
jgi:hypothetical protein